VSGTAVPGVNAVGHFGVTVPDLDAAIEFFETVLGFVTESVHELDPGEADPARCFGIDPRARARFAFMRLGDDTPVELIEWKSPTQVRSMPLLSDLGGTHLALWVDDLHAATSSLHSVPGVEVLDARPGWFVYFRTPWGLYVQLLAEWPAEPDET
jgi:glyoxylase I family protein